MRPFLLCSSNGIPFAGDINTATWDNWTAGRSAGSVVIQMSFTLNAEVSIDLDNHVLASTSFSFVTGDPGTLIFGVDGSATGSFSNVAVDASDIVIGSMEEYTSRVDFKNGTVAVADGGFSIDGKGGATVSPDSTFVSGLGTSRCQTRGCWHCPAGHRSAPMISSWPVRGLVPVRPWAVDGACSKVKLAGCLSYTPGDRNYAASTLELSENLSVDNGGIPALENGWLLSMPETRQTLSVGGGGTVYVGQDLNRDPQECGPTLCGL